MISDEKEYYARLNFLEPRAKASKAKWYQLWITLDPGEALPRTYQHGEESNIRKALDDLWRSDPPANYWRKAVAPYIALGRRSGGNEAWGVTMVWGSVDFRAMARQYGLPWCLRAGEVKASEVPAMLSNRQPLGNESGLRNTLSALRLWAILRPKEMRAWIDGEKFSPDLREALRWLLDNAGGGFAVPDPAKTP